MKFELGRLVMTRDINDRMAEDPDFMAFVADSLQKYIKCDWGETCKEDSKMNDAALENGDRILAAYGEESDRIWILTEHDRSVTTILFPENY